MSDDTKDVAQLVIRYDTGYIYRYLLAKRTKDGYWEFIGGKRKENETVEDAAYRELEEELSGVDRGEVDLLKVADPYPVVHSTEYSLYPVLMELDPEKARELDDENLSDEHSRMDWIVLDDFVGKETLGQKEALERLDLLERGEPQGDVVIGVARRGEKYLVMRRSDSESFTGCWEFPGGLLEHGEEPVEALKREIEEETGMSVADIAVSEKPYIGKGSTGFWRFHPFVVELGEGDVELSHEHDRYQWIELEEIHELRTYGGLKAVEKLSLL